MASSSTGTSTSALRVASDRSTGSSTAVTVPSNNSSLAYRHQAATLMQQIKNDIRGSKRLFSGTTEVSHLTHSDEGSRIERSYSSSWSVSEVKEHGARKKASKFGSPRRPSSSSRNYRSPRRASRNLGIEDADRTLEHEMSNMSIEAPWQEPGTSISVMPNAALSNVPHIRVTLSTSPQVAHAPLSYSSSSINRMVSSSTASGTITSSAPSFVKHPGPVQITHIAPSDVPALPQRVGRMVYDKDLMKWVRAAARVVSDAEDQRDQTTGTDGESEDPFKDIESLKEDDSGDAQENVSISEVEVLDAVGKHDQTELSRIEDDGEDVEMNDREEVDLASFSFDGPSVAVIRIVPSDESEEGEEVRTSDSESDDHDGVANGGGREDAGTIFESEDESSPEPQDVSPIQPVSIACPIGVAPVTPHSKPSSLIASMPRPAPKSTSATPVSAMKDPNRERYCTPAHRLGHRRSVSFSDGKRDGPIRGLNPKGHESDDDVVSLATSISEQDPVQGSFIPSARSKRIAEMMQNLESPGKLLPFFLCLLPSVEILQDFDDFSPTKSTGSGHQPTEQLEPFATRRPSSQTDVIDCSGLPRRVFSMSQKSRLNKNTQKTNATFLTECSFGLSHDRLVQVITDIQPFEPYWEELHTIDLSRKSLDGVARLKEFLPKLDSLIL